MVDFAPLMPAEREALARVRDIVLANTAVPCTGCGYCLAHCPVGIPILRYFSLLNEHARNAGDDWKIAPVYDELARTAHPASGCLGCRVCEDNCPQRINISERLREVSAVFEC